MGQRVVSPIVRRAATVVIALIATGCTTTTVRSQSPAATGTDMKFRAIAVAIDEPGVGGEQAERLRRIGTADTLRSKLEGYLRPAGFLDGTLDLRVDVDTFRLPADARWLTGGFKGNDVLGARVGVRRGDESLYDAHVDARLGAGDRSIGANYSADWAHESLVDMLAWEIAWALTGAAGRQGEDAVLDAGKRDDVKHAILILAHRGRLSYAEYAKFAALGKIGVENTALSAKYDACGARKIFTLGLSPCAWEPDYR